MKQVLALICLLLLTTAAGAQVYRHVDENGNVTFSDRPQEPGDEELTVQQPNTSTPPPSNAYPKPPPKSKKEKETASYTVSITSPENETIIPRGPGNFSVSASVEPSLKSGHKLQLLMDGAPRQEPQAGTSWALTNVFRGEHSISVAVVDGEGKTLASSESIKVYVFRPSTNDANRGPPKPVRPTPRN